MHFLLFLSCGFEGLRGKKGGAITVGTCNIVVISKVHETLKFLLQFTFLPGLRGYSLTSLFSGNHQLSCLQHNKF